MATHQLAKGLASLGRHGDSMLMHVNPMEVEGLRALGAMSGRQVTTNPHTGMPEAFNFLDFFTSLIPTGVGMLLGGPAGAAMGLKQGTMMATAAPVLGGMAAGAAVAGAKGDDPLMGGLMGGLGGYGGAGLSKTFGAMGGKNLATAGGVIPENAIAATPIDATQLSQQIGGANLTGAIAPGSAVAAAPMTYTQGLGQIGQGMKQLASDPFGAGYEAFKEAGGSAFDIAAPVGMAGLAGAQEDLYPEMDTSLEEKRKAEENKYRDPKTGLLNLTQASPGLRLMATGGTVGTNQSNISTGGIQDLYGTNDQTTGTQNLSKDGYGIGRLNTLAAEGSRAKAADTFYAAGGPIAFDNGGMVSLLQRLFPDLLAKLQMRASMANSSTSSTPSMPTTISPTNEPGMYPQASNDYMATKATDKGTFALEAAKGGYLDGHGDGMSDSIPATIEGKQPARLADGEFVIPADVVSHIGNGSSKAGSKQLYSMLDRIRKARTGHTKQGKEIKPQKYMPA
jgi:hypothetical protein